MTSSEATRGRATDHDLGLWFACFAGPAAWTFHSLLSEGLVPVACRVGPWPLDVLTVLMAGVAVAGVVVGAKRYAAEQHAGRHFVAGASILLDLFFAAVVVFEGVPSLVVNPCLA
jgi:hypothetical protein